jgi:hypothetical protein
MFELQNIEPQKEMLLMMLLRKTGLVGLFTFLILTITASATTAAPAKNNAAVDAAVTRIFAPYKLEDSGKVVWQQPFFSAATRILIRQWQRSTPRGEVTNLSGSDWLCQCHDWDFAAFQVTKKQYKSLSPAKVEAVVEIDLGFNEVRTTTLLMVQEKGRWEIDDIINASYPKGVKSEMRAEIAARKQR